MIFCGLILILSGSFIVTCGGVGIPDNCSDYANLNDPNEKLCRSTLNGCKTCNLLTSPQQCKTCLVGYYKTDNFCKSCVEKFGKNVQNCLESTVSSCKSGYFLQTTTACAACSSGCAACSSTSFSACTSCIDGYYLLNKTCFACSTSSVSCCKASTSNSSLCSVCKIGYYLKAADQLCYACLTNCKQCSNSSSCTYCVDGYYYSTTQSKCVVNPANCKDVCKVDGTITIKCINCSVNNYPNSTGSCSTCSISNCDVCANPSMCLECSDSYSRVYFLDSMTQIATEKCYGCGFNCSRCQQLTNNRKVCLTCSDMSLPDASTKSCIKGLNSSSKSASYFLESGSETANNSRRMNGAVTTLSLILLLALVVGG